MSAKTKITFVTLANILVSFIGSILIMTVGYGLEVKNWTVLIVSFLALIVLSGATQNLISEIVKQDQQEKR